MALVQSSMVWLSLLSCGGREEVDHQLGFFLGGAGFSTSDLCSRRGSVAVELGVGLDVVGVYGQGLGVQLVSRLVVALLERLVAVLFLGF